MWAAIAGSFALLAALLRLGWGATAWTIAALVLLLSCIGVCAWAVVQGRQAERDVRRVVDELAAARDARKPGVQRG